MTFPQGQQLTLRHRTPNGTDAYGDDAWTVTTSTVSGALAPGGAVEQGDGTMVETQPAAYLPPDTDVSWLDSVVGPDGTTYEVDGLPQVWDSPFTGRKFGVRVPLKAALRPAE